MDTFALLNAKNLGMTFDRQFDKKGRQIFEKIQRKGAKQLLKEKELVVSIKIKQNIFLERERVGGCYYKNKN